MAGSLEREMDAAGAAMLLPERDPRGHKGRFGHVFVVAGSLDYAGAALMTGSAALRTGSGLVSLWLPASLQPHLVGRVPELITHALPEIEPGEVDGPAAAADVMALRHDALLLGPGLKPGRGTDRLVASLLDASGCAATVDAGALNALSTMPGWWERLGRRCVLTPHPGEFARLGFHVEDDDAQRAETAAAAAITWGQVLVLKGARTVVAGPEGQLQVAPFSLPIMATGGSGDVLSGIIASLLGQGLEPFDAAALGVYLHGSAGEMLSERLGDAGAMATDLLSVIPLARRALDLMRRRGDAGRMGFNVPGSAPR